MTKEGAPTLGRPVILAAMAAEHGSVDPRDARKADPEIEDTKGAPKADPVDPRDARIIVDPGIVGNPADLAGAAKVRMNVHLGSVPNADRLNKREIKEKMMALK